MNALLEAGSSPFIGVLLHAVGGLAAASFYIPCKRVKAWSWETYWLAGGFFSWIVAPWVLALVILPQTTTILSAAPISSMFWTFLFGMLWGIGGLTFGLTMRYLGIALGYALVLGISAVLGTLIPPLFSGELFVIVQTQSGQVMLLGVSICLGGIVLSGKAGMRKQAELSSAQKQASVSEFNFVKGALIALFSGVMSSFMASAFAAGKPIAQAALDNGAPPLWQNLPVLIVVLSGGFLSNFIWCAVLAHKNGTKGELFGRQMPNAAGDAMKAGSSLLIVNVLFCALAGITWYLQFFFYGMGTTLMGEYEFSSWTLHMASIIIFSTLWGIVLKEWQGASPVTHYWNLGGLSVLILSMVVIGWGNTLASSGAPH